MVDKTTLKIEEMEEEEFDCFNAEYEEAVEKKDFSLLMPDDVMSFRKILKAVIHTDEEIDFYKKDYIKALEEKYIKPVKDYVSKLEEKKDALKGLMFDYMKKTDQRKIKYPDIATVSLALSEDKIIYPENEDELAEQLKDDYSEYIKTSAKFDKMAIKKYYAKNDSFPFDGLIAQEQDDIVKILKKK